MNKEPDHLDPDDATVAAILAFDLDAYEDEDHVHAAIAAAVKPFVKVAPLLRKPTVDDKWTAAEEAVAAASLVVECAARPASDDPWLRCQTQIDRLRKALRRHACCLIRNRIGFFSGYQVWVGYRWSSEPSIRIFPAHVSIDLSPSILDLASDCTRRDVGIAISSWQQGYDQGEREGADRICQGLKDLIEVDAAFTACACA